MSRLLPILFNTEMVRAIMDGRKTVTRRLVKPQPTYSPNDGFSWKGGAYGTDLPPTIKGAAYNFRCAAPYKQGDILYVRETWTLEEFYDDEALIKFKAGGKQGLDYESKGELYHKLCKFVDDKWYPSLFMPKEAARIFLKVTDVRLERLQNITEEQTEDEGFRFTPPCLSQVSEDSYCDLDGPCTSKVKYCDISAGELFGKVLWNSTIKKTELHLYGWEANPWVWVIEFERCEKPETENK